MEQHNHCPICNIQKVINENHKRNIDGELTSLCPICYKSMNHTRL